MDGWSIAWIVWLLSFGAIELPALLNKAKGDTLSEHVWRWFAVWQSDHPTRWRRALLLFFMAWLSVHFLAGGKFV